MIHVLKVFLEQGDVDDFAGNKVGVVEGGGKSFGVGVGAVTLRVSAVRKKGIPLKRREGAKSLGLTACGTISDLGGT